MNKPMDHWNTVVIHDETPGEAVPDAKSVSIIVPAGRLRLQESRTDADNKGIAMFASYSMYLFVTFTPMTKGRRNEAGGRGGEGTHVGGITFEITPLR